MIRNNHYTLQTIAPESSFQIRIVERHEHQAVNDIGVDDSLTSLEDSSSKVTDSTSTKHRCKHRKRKTKFGGFYRHGKK